MYHIDSDRQSAVVMGISLFEFGKGEYLTLTPRNKPWNEEEGTHGSVIRVGAPAQMYDIKAMILKGSPVNGLISLAVKNDMNPLTSGGAPGRLLVKDLDGTSLVAAAISYFYPLAMKNSTDPIMNEWEGFASIPPTGWYEGAARLLVPTA